MERDKCGMGNADCGMGNADCGLRNKEKNEPQRRRGLIREETEPPSGQLRQGNDEFQESSPKYVILSGAKNLVLHVPRGACGEVKIPMNGMILRPPRSLRMTVLTTFY